MKIRSTNPVIRYAYSLPPGGGAPAQTTLCALFWRCVGVTVIYSVPAALIGFYVFAWIVWTWNMAGLHAYVSIWVVAFAAARIMKKRRERKQAGEARQQKPPSAIKSMLKEAAWGIKHRVCPLIEIEDEQ